MRLDPGVTLAAIMVAVFASMVALAASYPSNARFVPLVVGIPGLGLALVQLTLELRRAARGEAATADPRIARLAAWIAAFLTLVLAFGFVYGGPLAVYLFLRVRESERQIVATAGALVAYCVLRFGFEQMLGLLLFRGLLVEWVLG